MRVYASTRANPREGEWASINIHQATGGRVRMAACRTRAETMQLWLTLSLSRLKNRFINHNFSFFGGNFFFSIGNSNSNLSILEVAPRIKEKISIVFFQQKI